VVGVSRALSASATARPLPTKPRVHRARAVRYVQMTRRRAGRPLRLRRHRPPRLIHSRLPRSAVPITTYGGPVGPAEGVSLPSSLGFLPQATSLELVRSRWALTRWAGIRYSGPAQTAPGCPLKHRPDHAPRLQSDSSEGLFFGCFFFVPVFMLGREPAHRHTRTAPYETMPRTGEVTASPRPL
jgi:hypothetical protein